MADESAVPVTALPQVRLRRYDVEVGIDGHGGSPRRLCDVSHWCDVSHVDGQSGLYRVVDREHGAVRHYIVRTRSVLDVADYEEPEPAEAPSGDGGS